MQNTTHAKLQAIDTKLKRWQSRLTRAHNAIVKLNRQRKRITNPKLMAKFDAYEAQQKVNLTEFGKPVVSDVTNIPISELPIADVLPEDGSIPGFLRRDGYRQASPVTEAQLKLEADREAKRKERSAALAKVRASKRKAKATGATRKMPLSGKEALDFIREGE